MCWTLQAWFPTKDNTTEQIKALWFVIFVSLNLKLSSLVKITSELNFNYQFSQMNKTGNKVSVLTCTQ